MERGRVRTRQEESSNAPVAFPTKESNGPAIVYDQMEREQEGIVNKLHREIHNLREGRSGSRSRSRSRSSSVSSQTSSRPSIAPRGSMSEHDAVTNLRRENDLLRRKVTDLTFKLAERDLEIERLKETPKE